MCYFWLWDKIQREKRTKTVKLQERKEWQRRHKKEPIACTVYVTSDRPREKKTQHSNLYTKSRHVIECLVAGHSIATWKWVYEDFFDALRGQKFSRTFNNHFEQIKCVSLEWSLCILTFFSSSEIITWFANDSWSTQKYVNYGNVIVSRHNKVKHNTLQHRFWPFYYGFVVVKIEFQLIKFSKTFTKTIRSGYIVSCKRCLLHRHSGSQ